MSLSRFVFWNVNKKDLTKYVCALADSTNADVIVLNENPVKSCDTLKSLQNSVSSEFFIPDVILETRFHLFCRNKQLNMDEVHKGNRTSFRVWGLGSDKALLVLVHGPDLRNYNDNNRQAFAQEFAREIRFVSNQQNTKKIVIMGDFNMNPFDSGMNLAPGLNAMMTRNCVKKGVRQYLNNKYDFYYNPMWGLFGDNTSGPAGTVYDTSSQGLYGWSLFDQVLVHHSLVPIFEDVRIVTDVKGLSLKDKNDRPDKKNISDHFPILSKFRRMK